MTETESNVNRTDLAVSRFGEGFNCSQAVFSAFAADLGLERDAALRIAGPFGGGMGRTGETCGAATGALMVLGLRFGSTRADDKAAKERMYALAGEFLRQFQARCGSTLCRELLGCDISTPEGLQAAREQQLFKSVCPSLVAEAAEIAEQLLA